MKSFLFNSFLFLFVLISCTSDEIEKNQLIVNYGTSFGECLGFCTHQLTLQKGIIIFQKGGYDGIDYQEVTCSQVFNSDLRNSIDNFHELDSFFKLPETIGCPDCADGGAEWVEIELFNGKKHRVTFEYHREPEILEDLILDLRSQMDKAEDCIGF